MMGRSASNIHEMRELARRRLPRGLYEFLERGAEDDIALHDNRRAFADCKLRTRVLRDVERIDQSTSIFGRKTASPLVIAPTGAAALFWHEGDLALAKGAAAAGIPFTIATSSAIDVEIVAAAAERPWFQLYHWQDRDMTRDVIDRANACGCEALMITVDTPVAANREFMMRNGFQFPFRHGIRSMVDILSRPRWLTGVLLRYAMGTGLPGQANLPADMRTPFTRMPPQEVMFRNGNISWDDIAALRSRWRGPLVIKGILHPDDARIALSAGAEGIVVSNHGGRALDPAIPALHALPAIADAVGGKTTLFLDSGIQRGSDVVKALAMGANAVLVGRAPLYGLAADGERGVARALAILQEEIARVIAQLGAREISEISSDVLAP